jgi:hypothetical protein
MFSVCLGLGAYGLYKLIGQIEADTLPVLGLMVLDILSKPFKH